VESNKPNSAGDLVGEFLIEFFVAHLMLGWLLSDVTRGLNFSPRTLAALTQPRGRSRVI
jgi:hypothetical protein